MSDTAISLVVFAFAFGGALLGFFLRTVLPQHHLSAESKDIVRVGTAFVVTTVALVLGLLVASAKAYFDAQSTELTAMSAKVVLLDRVLAGYGPEAKEVRAQLRADVLQMLNQIWSEGGTAPAPSAQGIAALFGKVQELSPRPHVVPLIRAKLHAGFTGFEGSINSTGRGEPFSLRSGEVVSLHSERFGASAIGFPTSF